MAHALAQTAQTLFHVWFQLIKSPYRQDVSTHPHFLLEHQDLNSFAGRESSGSSVSRSFSKGFLTSSSALAFRLVRMSTEGAPGRLLPGLNWEPLTQRLNQLERLHAHCSRQSIPPTLPVANNIFPNSSPRSSQEHFMHEIRLYQRINLQAKITLGYSRAITVLNRELQSLSETEPRSPPAPKLCYSEGNLSFASLASPEQSIFASTLQSFIDRAGLEKAVDILERETSALPVSSSSPSYTPPDPKLIETLPMPPPPPPSIISASNSHSSSSAIRYSPYDIAWGIDAPRWSGRGGKLKCDECRRAKRGWQVDSPP
jgi:hypothetical protein